MKKKLFSILLSLAMVITMMPAMTMTAFAASSGEVGYVFYTDKNGSNPSTDNEGKYFEFTVTSADATPKEVSVAANGYISGDCIIPSSVNDGTNTYSVTSIGELAFDFCSLTSVTIPSSVTSIGKGGFSACSKLTSVTIPEGVKSIGKEAFSYCDNLTSVTIPSSVTSIGEAAFDSCKNLENVTIPSSVTSISKNTFYGCKLQSVTIPEGVTSIGESAFRSCKNLTSVTIPSSVTSIGDSAFQYCSDLITFTVNRTTPPTIGSYTFNNYKTVYVPHGSKTAYEKAWKYCIIIDGYYVKIDEPFKDIISADPTYVEAIGYVAGDDKEKITLTVTPVDGYQLKDGSLKVIYDKDKNITPTATQTAGKYTFKMPAADVTVTAELSIWPDLSNAFKGDNVRENNFFTVSDDASTGVRTITLMQNITAGKGDSAFDVPQGKNVVLDLNGYTLDRGLDEATANGAVIYVNGDLTIKDTSANHGKITGGYSSNPGGGGICVRKGSLKLESGEIVNNKSKHSGGGVFIADGAKFIMSGGKISGNHTDKAGGGVFCLDDFTMTGGEISNNTSTLNGAGVYAQGNNNKNRPATKHFTMTSGTIKNNVSSRNGGGVYVDNYDMDAIMTGGEISNNSADAIGGGVCANSDITLGGSIKIIDNSVKGNANNVFLRNKEKSLYNPVIVISANAPLESGANIGVTLQTGLGTIAETETDISNYFFLDATGEKPVYDSSSKQLVLKSIKVKTIEELLAAIAAADSSNEYTIVLGEDINENQQITITDGKKIILDLNGHKLKRTYYVGYNLSMIYVDSSSSLTIMDSSDDMKGEICSGDAQYGAAIRNDGTLVLESGTINDCHARNNGENNGFGGAVYNFGNNAKFTMTGGAIKNCDALQYGGAIFNFQGTVTINDGTIENCEVTNGRNKEDKAGLGGAIWNNNKLTINGGTIQNCKSAYAGGAIFNEGRTGNLGKGRDSVFTMTGGKIENCGSASEDAEDKPETEIIYLRNSKMVMNNSAEIAGGIYTNNKPMATSESACQIDISGGKFNGSFSTTPSASDCAISITGGKFSTNPTSYVATGYKVKNISESPYSYEVVDDRNNTNPVELLQAVKSGSRAVKLSWNKVNGATKYVVYGAKCGHKFKKLKEYKYTRKLTVKKIKGKKLKAHTTYKFYVVAYTPNGKVKSRSIHFITGNTQGRYANVKSIKANKTSITLNVKESKRIGATCKMYKNKKHIRKSHGTALLYKSNCPSVAKVSQSGLVTAKSAGTATIYIIDIGGKSCKTTVVVK